MPELLKAPVTPAQQARDTLLGALVGLARATTSEPKTDDTDEVLNAGLRLAALNTRHLLCKPVCGLKAPLGLSCLAGTAVLSGTLLCAQKSTYSAEMFFAKGAKL